jgi:phospholipase/carboxylesterase
VIERLGPEAAHARAVVVLLHGRGRDPADVLELAERIALDDVAYLAPAAPGNSWYPKSFMAPIDENEPWLGRALATVDELARSVSDPRRLVLAGFSQGACLAAEYALRNVRRYGGLLLYTGGFIGPPGTRPARVGSFDGTPAFLGSSDPDAWVPAERVAETAGVLEALGAHVTMRIYEGMDHVVNDLEIAAGRELLRGVG